MPATLVPSGSVERASAAVFFSRPPASNCSSAMPQGSILEWHCIQAGALRAAGEFVIVCRRLIRHDEVRRDNVLYGQVVADQVLQELRWFALEVRARVAVQLGKLLAVHFEDLELIQTQPLGRELIHEPR